jgi:ribosomal-protein-serine acetyltransferase
MLTTDELCNESVKIRCYHSADIALLFEGVRESVAEVSPWLAWCHPGYSIEESTEWVSHCDKSWNEGTEFNFAIFDLKAGNFLGGVGLNQINRLHQFANLGYWVRSTCTGQGVATAGVLLAARFGFEELSLARIEIVIAVENKASQRVAEKAGASRGRSAEETSDPGLSA